MAKYPYYIPSPNVYKPWIRVSLGYKRTHRITPGNIIALIDSGADVCFCAKIIGSWLGVKFRNKKPVIFTAANRTKFDAIEEKITLYTSSGNYECTFYFSDNLPNETPIILGQLGFFDHFRVTFDLQNKEIEIV